jgi:hypothetical protein
MEFPLQGKRIGVTTQDRSGTALPKLLHITKHQESVAVLQIVAECGMVGTLACGKIVSAVALTLVLIGEYDQPGRPEIHLLGARGLEDLAEFGCNPAGIDLGHVGQLHLATT